MAPARPLRVGLTVAAALLIADQVTKLAMMALLEDAGGRIVVTGFFNLVVVWNRGVSFGMLSGLGEYSAVILSALSLTIVVFLLFWLRRAHRVAMVVAIGCVIGGAVGNVIDRIRFGAVFDFLDFHVAGWHWPAFNIADSAIVLGVGYLVIDSFVHPEPKRGAEGETPQ